MDGSLSVEEALVESWRWCLFFTLESSAFSGALNSQYRILGALWQLRSRGRGSCVRGSWPQRPRGGLCFRHCPRASGARAPPRGARHWRGLLPGCSSACPSAPCLEGRSAATCCRVGSSGGPRATPRRGAVRRYLPSSGLPSPVGTCHEELFCFCFCCLSYFNTSLPCRPLPLRPSDLWRPPHSVAPCARGVWTGSCRITALEPGDHGPVRPRQVAVLATEDLGHLTAVAWAPDGRTLATCCGSGAVLLWDARTWTCRGHLSGVSFRPSRPFRSRA